jgi:hypothetical protein
MLRQAQTSEPRALARFSPVRPRTAARANPPFVGNLPPDARAGKQEQSHNGDLCPRPLPFQQTVSKSLNPRFEKSGTLATDEEMTARQRALAIRA